MAKNSMINHSKIKILKEQRTLNTHPETVQDELFRDNEFFDPNDMLQVKYEMLRRVQIEGWNVQQATKFFGVSRPSFYKAQKAFQNKGLVGFLPERGGPKKAHKVTDEIMDFVLEAMAADETLRPPKLSMLIEERFTVKVHPRSIERAIARRIKKGVNK